MPIYTTGRDRSSNSLPSLIAALTQPYWLNGWDRGIGEVIRLLVTIVVMPLWVGWIESATGKKWEREWDVIRGCYQNVSASALSGDLLKESNSIKNKTASRSSPNRKTVLDPTIFKISVQLYSDNLFFKKLQRTTRNQIESTCFQVGFKSINQ